MTEDDGLRARFARQGEETLGKFAQELLENPLVTSALQRAFEAREKATQAQEVAMGALNLPSAADLERLTRRLRSVAQRLEGIEDGLDRVEQRMEDLDGASRLDERLSAIEDKLGSLKAPAAPRATKADKAALAGVEKQLGVLSAEVAELRKRLPEEDAAPTRNQERLKVETES